VKRHSSPYDVNSFSVNPRLRLPQRAIKKVSQVLASRVEPTVEFREISMQVLFADVMKRSHQRAREKRPSVFHAVGRDSVFHVPDAMIDRPMSGTHAAKRRRNAVDRCAVRHWAGQAIRDQLRSSFPFSRPRRVACDALNAGTFIT
jgi:hypothetical protein